jgi:adenosine deaminase
LLWQKAAVAIEKFMPETEQNKNAHRVSYTLPKADMHCHVSMALSHEAFIRRLKDQRIGDSLDIGFLAERHARYYPNLAAFHTVYEALRGVTMSGIEHADVTQDYLERIACEGAVYAELSFSYRPGDHFEERLESIQEGIRAARDNTCIEARIVVTSIRDMGVAQALKAAKHLARKKFEFVTGFGLSGNENAGEPLSAYRDVFNVAWHEAGLGLAPHAGEQFVHTAVDFLEALPSGIGYTRPEDRRRVRVGHGTLIHMSDRLRDEFKARAICLEACLSSNKRIDLPEETRALRETFEIHAGDGRVYEVTRPAKRYYDVLDHHPMLDLYRSGVAICLGSDNPLLQNTNIGKEYSLAAQLGANPLELLNFTRNAILHANLEYGARLRCLGYVEDYQRALQEGRLPPRTALGYRRAETHSPS